MLWSIDVDECSNSTLNTCDVNAECVDNEGSFRCLCNSGYTGDVNVCEGMFLTVLAMKFVIDERYLFVDIDECEVIMQCDRNALCSNSEGSFNCTCESGYSGDGTTCVGKISHVVLNNSFCFNRHIWCYSPWYKLPLHEMLQDSQYELHQ